MLRPRFSLRTLLLTVLALAASVTLWLNFGPWRVQREFPVDWGTVALADLSPDSKWVLSTESQLESTGRTSTTWNCLLIDSHSGQETSILAYDYKDRRPEFLHRFYYFSPNSHWIACGGLSPSASAFKLLDLRSMQEVNVPTSGDKDISDVAFSSDNRHLLLVSKTGCSRWLNLETNQIVRVLPPASPARFSENAQWLAYSKPEGLVGICEAASGKDLRELPLPSNLIAHRIEYLSERYLAVWVRSADNPEDYLNVRFLLFELQATHPPKEFTGFLKSVTDDRYAIVESRSKPRRTQVLQLPEYNVIGEIPETSLLDNPTVLDEAKILYVSFFGFYDLQTSKKLHDTSDSVAYLSPDRRSFLLDRFEMHDLSIRSVKTGQIIQSFKGERLWLSQHSLFSSDSRSFITHNDKQKKITLWTRHRPEPWYGLAWLPEFWLTLLLAPAALVSLWRDQK
jgi:WD40 repeat protein